jgi:MoaA/NifB/PqqE/SkfB family radical SAM enzyme
MERRAIAPAVARVITKLWTRALYLAFSPARSPIARRFRGEHGSDPPWFLVISPGHACNLRCTGCYANSEPDASGQDPSMSWPVLDRVLTEAQHLWDVGLFVFSGGEPLLYRSQGRNLLDAVEKHRDCLYLMFTNGTLIDREIAKRLSELGNLTPAISVEGMRQRTDARRGEGTFDRALKAMARLREEGVPFGISITVTRKNALEVTSDQFLDFFFEEQGAFYGFLFQHMPIGRSDREGFDQVPTPQQRVQLWRRTWRAIETKRIFLFDFWNSGPLVQGCVSAGRERGYLHIDWNGRVMPCVFVPYAVANLHQVYARGGTLQEVWQAPLLQTIRGWQRAYGYGREEHRPGPQDEAAREAHLDEAYAEWMMAYGEELEAASQPIWEEAYVGR